jgi:hypothetical protein
MVTVNDGGSYRVLPEFPTSDQLVATGVQFLLDGEEYDAASILISCDLELATVTGDVERTHTGWWYVPIMVNVSASRTAYEILQDNSKHPLKRIIGRALRGLAPDHTLLKYMRARVQPNTHLPAN